MSASRFWTNTNPEVKITSNQGGGQGRFKEKKRGGWSGRGNQGWGKSPGAPGEEVPLTYDPHWDDVILLLGYEETPVPIDASNDARTVQYFNGGQRGQQAQAISPNVGRVTSADDRIHVTSSPELNFGSGNFTIETWFYPTSTIAPWGLIMGRWISPNKSYSLWKEDNINLKLGISTNGTASIFEVSLVVPDGGWQSRWYFCAADYDGTTYRLYIWDSVEDIVVQGSSVASRTLYASTSGMVLGSDVATDNEARGYYDETRITKGVARYEGTLVIPTEPFFRFGIGGP